MDVLDTGVHVCKLAQLIGQKAAEFNASNEATSQEKLKRVSFQPVIVYRLRLYNILIFE
jgi:hypothetical protein